LLETQGYETTAFSSQLSISSSSVVDLISSPDGQSTASYGRDDVVKAWDAHTGRPRMIGIPLDGRARWHAGLDLSTDASSLLVHTRSDQEVPETLSVWCATRVLVGPLGAWAEDS